MPLPTEKNEPPAAGLLYQTGLLYGAQKIGKTKTGIAFTEKPLIIDAEGSAKGYSCYREPCPNWTAFRRIGADLAGIPDHGFTALIVDTVDELARHCQEQVISHLAGQENDLDKGEYHHPADFAYGKGWGAVAEEFRLRVAKLCTLGLPVLFISHEKEQVVESRAGNYTVFSPDVGTSGMRKWLLGFVDVILRAAVVQTTEGDRHVIIAQASRENVVGGRRPPGGAELPPIFSLTGEALYRALSARETPAAAPAPTGKPKTRQRGGKPAETPAAEGGQEQLAA